MTRPSLVVRLCAALGATSALLTLSTAGPGAIAAGHTPRPGEVVLKAGQGIAPEDEPDPAALDSNIADLDTASDQHALALAAGRLPLRSGNLEWKNVGPFGQDDPAGYPTGTIRFSRGAGMGVAIEVDPRDKSGNSLYVGNMGGLWYSKNAGNTWTNLSDGKLTRAAVGAIAVDPNRPTDLYVGTGIGFLTISGDAPGSGMWVSHDAGRTFHHAAKNIRGYAVNDILVTRSGVLAATTDGLYSSTNRGASWTRVALPDNKTHTGPAKGAYANWVSALAANPLDDRQVIAAVGLGLGKKPDPAKQPLSPGNGLYKSTAGVTGRFTFMAGTTQLTHPEASADPVGRIMLSWVKSPTGDTTTLWALVSDAGLAYGLQQGGSDVDLVSTTTGRGANATNTVLNGLYRSEDGGKTFDVKATPQSLAASVNEGLGIYPALGYGVGVQAYYNLWVQADPRDPNTVFFGLEEVFQSSTPTRSGPGLGQFEIVQRYWDVCGSTTYFDNITKGVSCPDQTPYYGGMSTHPDQHVGAVVKAGNALRMYTGNDGGFFREDSHALTTGQNAFDNKSWTAMNTLATVEPWHIARKPDGEYLTALQDNGAAFFAPGKAATLVSSGDGVNVVATPDPDVWFMSAQGAFLYVTKDHGKNITAIPADLIGAGFLSPLAIDPTDPNHLAVAGEDIKETTKGANTTTTYDPVEGTVVSTDWTESWDAKTSPSINPATKKAYAYGAQALALRGAAVYAGICGLCRNSLGDPSLIHTTVATNVKPGCVAKKANTACWHNAAGKGLPHSSIWNLAIDPTDVKTVYVVLNNNSLIGLDPKAGGTQRVMVSHDAGEHFSDITGNLPRTQARDVVVRGNTLIVATDNGVFTAPKTGKSWARFGRGLPQVRVNDLDLDPSGRYLTAGVYGRGVWVLDMKTTSVGSAGAGAKGQPVKVKPSAVRGSLVLGRGLPATGTNAALAVIAVVMLGIAFGTRRAQRRATA